MADLQPTDANYLAAKQHVAAVRGFYIHVFIFACVNAGLLAINVLTKTEWWFYWPLLGWGIGVIGHAIAVFMPIGVMGKDWQERRIQHELAKRAAKT